MTTSMKHYKLVIFDLDGTLTPERPSSAAPFEQRLLPGVKEKCKELREQGVLLTVATNQRYLRQCRFNPLVGWLRVELDIVSVYYENIKKYMKPNPSMLLSIMERFAFRPSCTLMVGDSIEDQKAAEAAGVDFAWAKDFFGWEQEEKQ